MLVVLVALTVVIVSGCSSGPSPSAGPVPTSPAEAPAQASSLAASRLLDPPAFAAAVAEPPRFTINVHVPFEGSIDGTDAEIPFDRIAADVARLPADRGTPVAIYCKSGRMSAIAATELDRLGYRDVVELRGGMDAWTQQGFLLRDTPVQGAPPASAPAVG